MAAYAALVSLMHIIDDIEHHHSPPISLDKQQVQSLTQIVIFLQEFLEGYTSPVADGNEADPLEMRIADAAYATEDVIESHIVDKIELTKSQENKISCFFNCSRVPKNLNNVSASGDSNHDNEQIKCINFYQDLQQVIEELDLIKKVAMQINAEKAMVHDQPQINISGSVSSLRPSSSNGLNNSIVACSDDVLLGLMEKLVAGGLDCQVIPIVGMGGIGKTTLARTVYSKPLIKEYFDICAWVAISQQYSTREILCQFICQATNKKREELSESSEDKLGTELYKYLFGRRFLIVMDDMWSIDAWDRIQHFFPKNGNGSRVLVTTRLSQLSSQLNKNYSLQMEFLNEVSSWNLFSKTVFEEGSCPRELEKIGKKIVENCKGLPLSIVVVGGILKNMEHTKGCWESIMNNLTSVVNLEDDKHCLRLLKMSYNHLPVYLKPCFLYMGVFEEDMAIKVSRLVGLWVSEGLIKPMKDKSLETIARGFLKDLVDRNLILIHELGYSGNIKYCKVHDLMRDLCLNEGKRDGFYHVIGQHSPQGINSQRRVVIPHNTSKEKVRKALQSMSHARSVICEDGEMPRCQNFGLLRIFHAYCEHSSQRYANALMFGWVNLRHLDVRFGSMSSFLSSVDLAWNLRTLIVSCSDKCTAQVGIWKMPQFRHIEFIFTGSALRLPDPPSDAVIMENLQILKGVENFRCREEVIKRIPNIRKLGINYTGCEAEGHDDYYCLSNIRFLCKLEFLGVYCDYTFTRAASLNKLTFPHSLKSIYLAMSGGLGWENVLENMGSLPLLSKLQLFGGWFRTGKWEIVEGQFPALKFLKLNYCGGLKHWTAQESSVFPSLEYLGLFGLKELEEIPSEIGNTLTLQKLELSWCSESAVMSVKEIVDEQVELQGELPFHVKVSTDRKKQALRRLAGPNFEVIVY